MATKKVKKAAAPKVEKAEVKEEKKQELWYDASKTFPTEGEIVIAKVAGREENIKATYRECLWLEVEEDGMFQRTKLIMTAVKEWKR